MIQIIIIMGNIASRQGTAMSFWYHNHNFETCRGSDYDDIL